MEKPKTCSSSSCSTSTPCLGLFLEEEAVFVVWAVAQIKGSQMGQFLAVVFVFTVLLHFSELGEK